MELSPYLKVFTPAERPGRVALFGTRRCALLEVSAALWERIQSGDLTAGEEAQLLASGILVASRAEEQALLRATFDRLNRESRSFSLLVTLTLACNLACPYCYEDPFRGEVVMADGVADRVLAVCREQIAAGRDLLVDFYGGEALMALPLLRRMAAELHDAAERGGVGCRFSLVTNGTLLTRAVVEELQPLGLTSARITLDGPRDIHDRQRPFISGRGSYERIVTNMAETWDLLTLQLGGNFSRDNYQRFPELLDDLLERGITPEKLAAVMFSPIIPKADGSMAGDFGAACACSSEPWLTEASLFLRQETLRRGFAAPRLRQAACMLEFEHNLVVGCDGGYYKCPAFMGDPELRVGDVWQGVTDYRGSHHLDIWKTPECLECPYLPLCFGGCRHLGRLQRGTMAALDCRRSYYDAALERLVVQELTLRGTGAPKG